MDLLPPPNLSQMAAAVQDRTAKFYKSGIDRRFATSKPNAKTTRSAQFSRPSQNIVLTKTRVMLWRVAERARKIACVCQRD
jgi:hypothetical protein